MLYIALIIPHLLLTNPVLAIHDAMMTSQWLLSLPALYSREAPRERERERGREREGERERERERED